MISKVLESVSRAMNVKEETEEWPDRFQNFTFQKIAGSFHLDFSIIPVRGYCAYPLEGKYSIVVTKTTEELSKFSRFSKRRNGDVSWFLKIKFIKDGVLSVINVGKITAKEIIHDRRVKTPQLLDFWKRLESFYERGKKSCRRSQ